MIKVDFHIHTISVKPWDRDFTFSMDKLSSYVEKNDLDCIAITNHNRFDKEQYKEICRELKNTVVFPGIEVHVLNGHVIVVGSEDDTCKIEEISNNLSSRLKTLDDSLSIEEFSKLLKDKNLLIVPHYYNKSKSLALSNIEKISSTICVGEVGGPKSFLSMLNDESEKLTPVIFSDIRCAEQNDNITCHETRYTYIKVDSTDFKIICDALKTKKNVGISPFEDETFDLLNGTVRGHKGINVILGNRSTGKSFLLDNIYASFFREGKVLYIKQFELAKNSETNTFKSNIDESNEIEIKKYCSDINSLLLNIKKMDFNKEDYNVDNYLRTLKNYADKHSLENAFSKMKLFNYNKLNVLGKNQDHDVAKAISELLNVDSERREIIEQKVPMNVLIELLHLFIGRAKKFDYEKYITDETNSIAETVSRQLAKKSPMEPITSVNFIDVYEKIYTKNKTDYLLLNIREQEIMDKKVSDKFHRRISVFKPSYGNKERYKNETGQTRIDELKNPNSLFDVFINHANDYFSQIDDDSLYSFFIGKLSSVTTEGKKELSGGEKAEYILIDKLQNYDDYDIVLIDEMESSFDNVYLNRFINNLLHEISEKCTIFISTHNNNLGVSLKPDYYIYHEYVCDGDGEKFVRFHGSSTSEQLQSSAGDIKKLSEILLGTMEASIEAYDERKAKYEIS